jgi:hypothetical protein
MKRTTILALTLIMFASCTERSCQSIKKGQQYSERNYDVTLFSGGDTVFHDRFKGIVNDDSGESSIYYFKGDSLIEIHGDYVVKSVKP